ncbi:MAG: hypothetical protein ACTSRH_08845 [Promethearchaeota archaeon]
MAEEEKEIITFRIIVKRALKLAIEVAIFWVFIYYLPNLITFYLQLIGFK